MKKERGKTPKSIQQILDDYKSSSNPDYEAIKKTILASFKKNELIKAIKDYLNDSGVEEEERKQYFKNIFLDILKANACEDLIVFYAMLFTNFMDLFLFDTQKQDFQEALPWLKLTRKGFFSLAQSDLDILIVGDTGTGKEVMAQAIHDISKYRHKEMEAVSCVAIPDTLFESELFGTKKGAYSDATDKEGILEKANGTTLFIDEIGNMLQPTQAKLLRVIETKSFCRVGSTKKINVKFRIIGAVQRKDIEANKIFTDLLTRLSYPYCIELPTLNERLKVIAPMVLVKALRATARKLGFTEEYFIDNKTNNILLDHEYRGNYRELQNIFTMALFNTKAKGRDTILPDDLSFILDTYIPNKTSLPVQNEHSLEDINLKDICSYADEQGKRAVASIIEEKIKQIKRSGRDIKTTLKEEGHKKTYENFLNMVSRRTGKGINEIN